MNTQEIETIAQKESTPFDERKALQKWQNRMLWLMQGILIFVTLFFFFSGFNQLRFLQQSILQGSEFPSGSFPDVTALLDENAGDDAKIAAARLNAQIILESNILQRRYHQANTVLMTMAWIRYLGFSTGMVLSVLGSSFILGKLRETPTDLKADGAGWKISLGSTSPGIIMVILGTILMMTTIVRQQSLDVKDVPVFLRNNVIEIAPPEGTPPPTGLPQSGD